ncbi:hypothetical protein G6L37_06455 [Agrobacterium rubi]|nr:hypothetical protein [Agrobacterium rubi]NTF25004.1 hypothetical protein [Agrobacterium rubi]
MLRDASQVPPPLVPASRYQDFVQWASECGYDESYFNRWDSKYQEIQSLFLEEVLEVEEELPAQPK